MAGEETKEGSICQPPYVEVTHNTATHGPHDWNPPTFMSTYCLLQYPLVGWKWVFYSAALNLIPRTHNETCLVDLSWEPLE